MAFRRSSICRRLGTLERHFRARLLRWIASGAVISESDGSSLEEQELEALSEAVDRARRDGR
jgi:hypothetical protein